MRIISKRRGWFNATHKGCEIQIERETDPVLREEGRLFYIIVIAPDGGHLYDGWSPIGANTMAEAKREALYGSQLKARPS